MSTDSYHHAHSLLQRPLTALHGVGPKLAAKLAEMQLHTFEDALFHLPFRYEDRTRIIPIANLKPGERALIEGAITGAHIIGSRKRSLVCALTDDTGKITLRFFHFSAKQKQTLQKKDMLVRCFGEVKKGYRGGLEMTHPEYRTGTYLDDLAASETLTPIYPTTQGVSQLALRKVIKQVLAVIERAEIAELLPAAVLAQYQWPSLTAALSYLHAPPPDADLQLLQSGLHPMQQRLSFEELWAHQVSLQKTRRGLQQHVALAAPTSSQLVRELLDSLPFELTAAQKRVWQDIEQDLSTTTPMLRLLQGDVGSGKTIIAALAVLQVVATGKQAAVMAPTELLAEQHYRVFSKWCAPLGISVGFLSSGLKSAAKKATLAKIADGEYAVVIGTHALFQQAVEFKDLALVVVDEQHRFGVHQRLALMQKGSAEDVRPHQLVMTATPIPRTLSMMAYGDLDCSVIDALPPGRKPITTRVLSQHKRPELIQKLGSHCQTGQQAYWVCTLVEESEALQAQAAEVTLLELQAALPQLNIELVHGRMSAQQKEAIMHRFLAKEIDVLVATTVIEVGVDVANASLMVIDNSERLGLAQLHQLRGRVGRGNDDSYCMLLYKDGLTQNAKQRLEIMRSSQDGFYIADQDLKMRGPGEVLGVRQSGLIDFKMVDLLRDQKLVDAVVQWSSQATVSPQIEQALIQRWLKRAALYGAV